MLVSPDIAVSHAEVLVAAETRMAAEHYPLVADIALSGSEVGIGRK